MKASKHHEENSLEWDLQQLEFILKNGHIGTWRWDIPTGKIVFNNQWGNILGFQHEELKHFNFEKWLQLIHPADKQAVLAQLNDCIEGKTTEYSIEHRKITKSGTIKWVHASGRVYEWDEQGKAKIILGIHQDLDLIKQAESKLAWIEHQKNIIFDTMQEGVVIQNLDGHIISCNIGAENILGLSFEQMQGSKSVDPLWHCIKEDGQPFPGNEHPAMLAIKNNEPVENIIMGVYKPDASLTWIQVNAQLLKDEQSNETYAVFTTFVDITEKLTVQHQNKQLLERLENIVNQSPSMIYEFCLTPSGKISFPFVSEKVRELFGLTPESLKHDAAPLFALIDPAEITRINESIAYSALHLTNWREDCKFILKDGREIWAEAASKPFLQPNGNIHWIGYLHDISWKKKTEEDLRRFSLLAQNTTNAVLFADTEGKAIWVNESFTKLTGYTITDIKGKKPGTLLQCSKTDKQTVATISKLLKARKNIDVEILNKRKDGCEYWIHLQIQPIYTNGQFAGFMSIESDITHRKTEEKEKNELIHQLSQNIEDLKQFAYIVSHNLRSPLSNILGIASFLQEASALEGENHEFLSHLYASAVKLDEILKDLNGILTIQNKQYQLEEIDLKHCFDDIKELALGNINNTQIEIEVELNGVEKIYSVKPFLNSIFSNLISNAIKYAKTNVMPHVKIAVESNEQENIFTITDNGIGIDTEKNKNKIFGLYQRFTTQSDGKGLGLFITKANVKSLGGKITVDSIVGQGTTFKVYLPKQEPK